jgi:uncharacterized caspase-like protein
MKTTTLLFTLALCALPLSAQSPLSDAKRRALLIGNASYESLPALSGPVNDIRDMDAVLEKAGFSVKLLGNASREAMERAGVEFTNSLRQGDVAMIYYSGAGVEIDGENYLIPVDIPSPVDEAQLKFRSYPVRQLIDSIQNRGVRLQIVVLDTCRENPFRATRGVAKGGLAPMYGGRATFIAYASAPGELALDEKGNGVFTRELVKVLATPGLELKEVFARAGAATYQATSGRQSPWFANNVYEPFYFINAVR